VNTSKLSERLREVVGGARRPGESRPRSASAPPAGGEEAGAREAQPRAHGADEVLGGRWRSHGTGKTFVVERRLEPGARHGRAAVGELADGLARAASFAPTLAGGSPARPPFLFLDLETTGLSGGAGTLAFLVGCGWFDEEGAFVTRQHLLLEFADERSMLSAVTGDLEGAGALVSFNGKSFDAPVLETRFLFHRLEWTGGRLPHIDVLHPSRRFWRNQATEPSGCSLASLEGQLFDVRRAADVPGFEIPGLFFRFVRSGDSRALAGVLDHNRHDLLSLAALSVRLLSLLADGPAAARDAGEALALGQAYERAGFEVRANESFERALSMTDPSETRRLARPHLRVEALRALACAARRSRRHDAAVLRWRQLLDLPGCPAHVVREANEALAIHNEHRSRDLAAARSFALRSLEVDPRSSWRDEVRHRLARIDRKIERTAAWPSLFDSRP
jgi:uncharacterized protein YprB with RNaseH-like and TPR domain